MARNRSSAPRTARTNAYGGALVGVVFLLTALAAFSLAALSLSTAATREQAGAQRNSAARFAADAGLAQAVAALRAGEEITAVGSEDEPIDFGGASYWVELAPAGGGLVSLVSTGEHDGARSRVELVVRRGNNSVYRWGAFGDEQLTMDSNSAFDSYDSREGTYTEQATNGTGAHAWAANEGVIGSNQDILVRQNATVHGGAHPGPTGATTVMGNATVSGSTTQSPELVELPAIEVPQLESLGNLTVPRNGSFTIPSGAHAYGDLVVDTRSRLQVTGPAQIVFRSVVVRSGSQILVDAIGGPVEIYVERDFVLNSNALVASTTRTPSDLALFLDTDNITDPDLEVDLDEIDFDSNSKLYGTIYAPRAAIAINSNFELFGAVIARRLLLDSYAKVHYDEALEDSRGDGWGLYERVAWRILPVTASAPAN